MTTTLTPDPGDGAGGKAADRRRLVGPGFALLSHQADGTRGFPVHRVDIKRDDGTIVGIFASIDFDEPSKAESRAPSVRRYLRLAVTGLLAPVSALRAELPSPSAEWLTGIAVFLAGRERERLAEEWRAHLSGWPDRRLSRARQLRDALGFVLSAVKCRLGDAACLAWKPVDAVLGSRTLSNLFVWGPVVAMLLAIVHHDGRFGLVADIQDPIALGAFLYCVIKAGRKRRDVKPPEPKARRADKSLVDERGKETPGI